MNEFTKAKEYIDKILIQGKKIPYIGVKAYRNGECLLSYISTNGSEYYSCDKVAMFSMSKPVTVVGFMRLIEQGRASLDDKLIKYLPNFKKAFIFSKNGEKQYVGDKITLRHYVGDKITLRHLLTMSAGFNYDRFTAEILANKDKDLSLEESLEALLSHPLDFYPGDRFQYSLCHDILAAVIEKITGMKFSSYINEYIFKPLGMHNSSFKHRDDLKGIATLYNVQPNGEIKEAELNWFTDFNISKTYESGGAGLISTLDDYGLFANAVVTNKLLKQETINLIKTPQFERIDVKNSFTCVQGDDYTYGLGERVRIRKDDSKIPLGEFGWDGAAGSYVLFDSENKLTIVITMSLLNWPDIFIGDHLKIASLIYDDIDL